MLHEMMNKDKAQHYQSIAGIFLLTSLSEHHFCSVELPCSQLT